MANTTDWLNITSQSGSSGETRLTLTARRNLSPNAKYATITAYNPVYNISARTYVSLAAYVPELVVTPTLIGVPASGGTYELTVSADCSWVAAFPDIVSSYSTSAGTGSAVITFTVPSTICASTLVGNIVVTDESGQVSRISRVEQYGEGAHISYSPSALTIPYYGGSDVFTVTADSIYSVSAGSGQWYTVSDNSGYTGSTQFTVSAGTINSGTTDWTDNITIVGPDGVAGTIAVTQLNQGQYSINYTADTSTVDYSGETRTITIDATDFINSSITVSVEGAPDVTYSYSASGLTRGIITLNIPQNPDGERTFTVVVRGRRAASQNYATAAIQYTQEALALDFVTDTSNVRGSGEVRTITILNSNINSGRTELNLPSDFPSRGAYTVSGNVITLTYPTNPSSSATRTWTIRILTQTNDGVNLSGSYTITQDANVIYAIPYTADTTTVNETGETRIITIDTSNLISSSITVGVVGATGITATYDNGVVTVIFPENYGPQKDIDITINAQTNGGDAAEATLSYTQDSGDIHNMPLRFNITDAGNIYWKKSSSSAESATIQYRINKGNWTTITSTTGDGAYFGVNAGDTVEFIGDNASYDNNSFASTCDFTAAGNIMSLINSTGYSTLSAFTANEAFRGLFSGCTGLTSAENLILPATTLADSCYSKMFQGCTGLTTAPELPAATLAASCYGYMFSGCTGLATAPELPATTLVDNCYESMFRNCTSLTTAPELPATAATSFCYSAMFSGCTSLTTAPELPATTLVTRCYYNMFAGCTSLVTAPSILPATTLATTCYGNMFQGCRSLTTAPVLPAKVLVSSCYDSMFMGCSNLNYIKCLATDISANRCTYFWVNGVASAGTFVKNVQMTSWTTGNNGIPVGWIVEPRLDTPLTFDILTNGEVFWAASDVSIAKTIEYKKNDGNWTSITSNVGSQAPGIVVSAGDTVQFRGDNATYYSGNAYNSFASSCNFTAAGNIMSLINSTDYPTLSAFTTNNVFFNLFNGCTGLIDVGDLLLPATTLADSCYRRMFRDCTSLTTAPELPATTLADNCYMQMFQYCYSLISAPELPATTLEDSCYYGMFTYCTSLTTAPELPATTLADYCYESMFFGCSSLATAPALPATTLANYCYTSMFQGCTSLTTAPALPVTTLAVGCYINMFSECTSLTTAPELPATTLTKYCYEEMFNGCTSLTIAPELPAATLTDSCYSHMFDGCLSLNYIKCLATDISADGCTNFWVRNVASTGTFATPSSTNWTIDESGIPYGWTRVNA